MRATSQRLPFVTPARPPGRGRQGVEAARRPAWVVMGRTARRKFFWDGWSSRLPRRRARTPVLQRLSRALPEAALWLLVDVVEAIVRFTQNVVLRRLDGSADLDIEVITQVVGVQEEPYVDPLHHWELTRELWYELPGGQRMYLPGHSRYVEDPSLQEALRRAREQRPSRLWWREEGEDDGEVGEWRRSMVELGSDFRDD